MKGQIWQNFGHWSLVTFLSFGHWKKHSMVHFLKVCQNQPSAIQPAAKFCNICSTKVLDARIFSYAILPPLRLTKSNHASNDPLLPTLTPEHHSGQPCSAMFLIEQSSKLKFWQCLPNCLVKSKALIEVTDLLMFTNLFWICQH